MPSLKEFIAALQAGWFPALAALVGCSIVVAGDWFQLPYLNNSPDLLILTAVIVGVFSFSVLTANVAYLPVIAISNLRRMRRKRRIRDKFRKAVIDAPDSEKAILAYLVTTGKKAFVAEVHDRRITPLVAKGMIVRGRGTNSVLEWPFVVQDDVWEFLLENQDAFHIPDAEEMSDPFHWREIP